MLSPLVIVVLVALVIAVGVRSGAFALLARMTSRVLVSGRRREPPVVQRAGGLADLPPSLRRLVHRGRELGAAVDQLRQIAATYYGSFETSTSSLRDDRRHQAARRDFEDAVIHVTLAADGWCQALPQLDAESRARLSTAGPLPDVPGLLRRFPWLPRQVYEVGTLHFRSDAPDFEQRLWALDGQWRALEAALTSARASAAYR